MGARRSMLVGAGILATVAACEVPTEPELTPSVMTVVGNTINAKVGRFNLDVALGRGTRGASVSGPLLSVEIYDGDTFITCNHVGQGHLSVAFDDGGGIASYTVVCRAVTLISLGVGLPFNLDRALYRSEGRDVKYVVQSDGLIKTWVDPDSNDVYIECVKEGAGTLWVFFTDDTDYYDLTCHDQGRGG